MMRMMHEVVNFIVNTGMMLIDEEIWVDPTMGELGDGKTDDVPLDACRPMIFNTSVNL